MCSLYQQLLASALAFLCCLCIGVLGWRYRYFQVPHRPLFPKRLSLIDILPPYLIFIASGFLFHGIFTFLFSIITRFSKEPLQVLTPWLEMARVSFSILALFFFIFFVHHSFLKTIFFPKPLHNKKWKFSFKHYLFGIFSWPLCFPFIFLASSLASIFISLIFGDVQGEQAVVSHLKENMKYPPLFIFSLFNIAIVVPFLEEILYRGFLQTWLRQYFPSYISIALCSLLFAISHFSVAPGLRNIEIISSIFVLSCFLGFLYERNKTLWAPIGLHTMFNTMSILLLIKTM